MRRLYSSLQRDLERANTRSLKFKIVYHPRQPKKVRNHQLQDPQPAKAETKEFTKYSDNQITSLIKDFLGKGEDNQNVIKTSHLYDDLATKLSLDPRATILPYQDMALTNPTPYQQKCLVEHNPDSRLSVTKIIPSIWCELKKVYRLYQGHVEEPTNQSMTRGKIQHLQFELSTHPVEEYILKDNMNNSVVYELDTNKSLLDVFPKVEEATPITEGDLKPSLQEQHEPSIAQPPSWFEDSIDLAALNITTAESKLDGNEDGKIPGPIEVIADPEQVELTEPYFSAIPRDVELVEKEKMLYLSRILKCNEDSIRSDFESLLRAWTRNLLRLTDLLKFGECREILVFAIYDMESHQIINDYQQLQFPLDKSKYLTISGVIDHLTIESDYTPGGGGGNEFEEYQKEMKSHLRTEFDLSELLTRTNELATKWNELIYIKLKDLKTRAYRSIPDAKTQIVHEQQVGIYLKFLKLLSSDSRLTYHLLKINFMKRGIDLDEPIPPSLLIELMLQNNYLIKDFEAIQSGELSEFPPFDLEPVGHPYDPSEILDDLDLGSNEIPDRFQFIFQKWETPPTFKYILARQSQVFESLAPLLNQDKVSIEYSTDKLGKFAEIQHTYSEKQTDWCINEGLKLWFGKRVPSPPQLKNACSKCEFQSQCGWFIKHGVL